MNPQPQFSGSVRPPADLLLAARNSMTPEQFDDFRVKYPDQFTPDQLCQFVDALRKEGK